MYFGWRIWQFLVVKIYLCQLILFFVISFFFLDDAWKLTIVGGLFFFFLFSLLHQEMHYGHHCSWCFKFSPLSFDCLFLSFFLLLKFYLFSI